MRRRSRLRSAPKWAIVLVVITAAIGIIALLAGDLVRGVVFVGLATGALAAGALGPIGQRRDRTSSHE
jgi:hypothetical protein